MLTCRNLLRPFVLGMQQHQRLPGRLLLALQPGQPHMAALLGEADVGVALSALGGAAAAVARMPRHKQGYIHDEAPPQFLALQDKGLATRTVITVIKIVFY